MSQQAHEEIELSPRERALIDIAVKKANRKIGREISREDRRFKLGGVFGELEYTVRRGDYVTFHVGKLMEAGLIDNPDA